MLSNFNQSKILSFGKELNHFTNSIFQTLPISKTLQTTTTFNLMKWQKVLQKGEQEGHDGPEIAHLSLLTKHAPSSFPVT